MAPAMILLKPGDDLQAAVDAVAEPGLIELAAGIYPLPGLAPLLWHKQALTVRGPGPQQCTIRAPHATGYGVWFLPNVPLTGAERVPLAGVLDETVPADWHGWRLEGGRKLCGLAGGGGASHFTGYQAMDHWRGVRRWTLEFCGRFPTPSTDTCPLFGLDYFEGRPEPWLLSDIGHVGSYLFQMRTAGDSVVRLTWPCGPRPGTDRVRLQLDFEAAAARAAVNGADVPVTVEGDWPPGDGFAEHWTAELTVWSYRPWDLLGLRWEDGLIEGADDWHRYVNWEGPNVFALHGQPEDQGGRFVRAKAGYGTDRLLIQEKAHHGIINHPRLEGVAVQGDNHGGVCVVLGNVVGAVLRNCSFTGAARGLGAWRGGVSYPTTVADCNFDGDIPWHSYTNVVNARNLTFGPGGRRFILGEGLHGAIDGVFAANPDRGRMSHYIEVRNTDDNGQLFLRAVQVNDEGGGRDTLVSPFLADARWQGGFALGLSDSRLPLWAGRPGFYLTGETVGGPCTVGLMNVRFDGEPDPDGRPTNCVAESWCPRWTVGPAGALPVGVPWSAPNSAPPAGGRK
jgi:hypothetical protein